MEIEELQLEFDDDETIRFTMMIGGKSIHFRTAAWLPSLIRLISPGLGNVGAAFVVPGREDEHASSSARHCAWPSLFFFPLSMCV
jgi:hypothetical protein